MRRALLSAIAAAGLALLAVASLGAPAAPGPDPFVQAIPDGCQRPSQTDLFSLRSPEWVYVDDRNAPSTGPPPAPRWGHGVVRSGADDFYASHPAVNDLPADHRSYDFVFNLLPDPSSAFLLAGDPAARTGNYQGSSDKTGRLHIEWEEGAFPPFAWPSEGDRVSVLGSWVWDCGHWDPGGETTELHPFRAIWVQRNPGRPSARSPFLEAEGDLFVSTDKTPAASQADCAHRVKGNPDAFRACVLADDNWQNVAGSYRFFLRAPRRPSSTARLVYRIVDRGSTSNAPQVRVSRGSGGVKVALDLFARDRRRLVVAKQVFVGWSPVRSSPLPEHLRLRFLELHVHRAMDPGCPLDNPGCPARVQSTRPGTISAPPGEWNLYWNVAGIWGQWRPRLIRPRDGQRFPGRQTLDFYVARRVAWRLLFLGRECDLTTLGSAGDPEGKLAPCPSGREYGLNDGPGVVVDRYRSGAASVGIHRSNGRDYRESTCPKSNRRGCFTLTYRVTIVNDARARAAKPQRR